VQSLLLTSWLRSYTKACRLELICVKRQFYERTPYRFRFTIRAFV
jgi:hypothetical protein